MKKLMKVLLLCTLIILTGCSTNDDKKEPATDSKESTTLKIVVNSEDKELFNDKITVEGEVETLADFLEEADELNVVMEDSEYGKKIMSILDVATEDWAKGPWWLYESDNNESCKAAGQCDAASSLKIKDGDSFTFNFQGM